MVTETGALRYPSPSNESSRCQWSGRFKDGHRDRVGLVIEHETRKAQVRAPAGVHEPPENLARPPEACKSVKLVVVELPWCKAAIGRKAMFNCHFYCAASKITRRSHKALSGKELPMAANSIAKPVLRLRPAGNACNCGRRRVGCREGFGDAAVEIFL